MANYPLDGPTYIPESKAASKGKSGVKAVSVGGEKKKKAAKKAPVVKQASGKASATAPLSAAFLKNYPLSFGTYLIPGGPKPYTTLSVPALFMCGGSHDHSAGCALVWIHASECIHAIAFSRIVCRPAPRP